ncbi:hypothetical protein HDU76_004382, partial [Blyttiomyces sp. JEL0837]
IPVSGGHWGSTVIDKAFFDLLELICGAERLVELKTKYASRWLQLGEEWERKKCAWDGSENSEVLVMLPPVLSQDLEEQLEAFTKTQLGQRIGEIELDGERLVLSNAVMNYLSKGAITKTVDHLNTILNRVPRVSKILLVGNFANSIALQNAFRAKFEPRVKVLIPTVPGECVARGAVILGNRPRNIEERRSAFSYGYATSVPFVEGVHPPIKRIEENGKYYCKDSMHWLIKYGEVVPFGKTVSSVAFPLRKNVQRSVNFTVYEGQRDGIEYADERGCRKLGFVDSADCDPQLLTARGAKFQMLFGNSELFVTVKDPRGKVTSAALVYK